MITNFGKFTRKLRIENDETMMDMAIKIGVTSSYLSTVENGKRILPSDWQKKLLEQYDLTDKQAIELAKIVLLNQLTERESKALTAALSVIYLNDSSDYINGLWEVLRALLGDTIIDHDSFSIEEWKRLLE